jgi:hypothetical protein
VQTRNCNERFFKRFHYLHDDCDRLMTDNHDMLSVGGASSLSEELWCVGNYERGKLLTTIRCQSFEIVI